MFEGLILRELSSEDLHRPLRAKELIGIVVFLASFGVVGGALMAIPLLPLRIVAGVVVFALAPFYVRAMVRVFRRSGTQSKRDPAGSPPPGSGHAA